MNIRIMNSEQARTNWRTLLDLASQEDTDVVIERHGKPTAAVIGYETYQALQSVLEAMRTQGIQSRGQRMANMLEQLADLPAFTDISDPVSWQRAERTERPLPHRDP
jgi:prevent-host-death family protein